ncbi:phage regulatory CII family protein [Vibrio scophthalmi]|uniref:Regulatory protein CII n=1 Tax=Vibrio scophthalmi TaxID=45658 RepID=A0A1C7F8H6_9VIBR|nr:phage regulatory CII family protein [Vibrio scophthalmi]ANU36260.1 Regulatory protein CII [Vibrio scophthalmi]
MNDNIAMYELRERKQQAYDAVCCDFVINHDVEKLARVIGIEGQALRNMLNPAQPRHLTPPTLAMLCRVSGDYTILNTLLAEDGVVSVRIPQTEEEKTTYLEKVLQLSVDSGELSSDALAMCNAERLPRSRKRKTLAKAHAALSNLVSLINDLEHRTTGLQPLIQMGSEFLASGAPLPGLA